MTNLYDLTRPNQPFERFIADKVKQLRILKKMSTLELSKILGINERQMYKHESGTFWISAGRLLLIAKALNVPVAYFYQGFSNKHIEMVLANTLGSKLKTARLMASLSVKEVSEKLKITPNQLYNYENDISTPTLRNAIEMTQLYNIDLNIFSNVYREKDKIEETAKDETTVVTTDKQNLLFYEEVDHGELIGKDIDETKEVWGLKSTYKFLKNKLRG